jgi:RNA polymerase sigma-70 factor (ECF subfamily)
MNSEAEFERVMRQEGPRVYTLAVRLTGNLVDGQDLAQETFVKAYEGWGRFRGEAQVSSWFYRICVNLWKNRVRYEKRRSFWKHISLSATDPDDESPTLDLPSSDSPAGTALETGDLQQLVQSGLAQLDPEDRLVLILRDMEDKSYEDVARILDVPLGTVKSRVARCREKLRALLAPQLGESL